MLAILLAIFAFLLLIAGLIGSIVPILPGPPLSFVGLLALQWSGCGSFSSTFLWMWAAITLIITFMDYLLPAYITRKFGGSRWASIGSLLGLFAGLFLFPPIGLVIGSFLGALIGELLYNQSDIAEALKVALGTFLAFIVGAGAKLIVCFVMLFYAVKALF